MILYVLRDPRDHEVRYVGKTTKSAERRLRNHITAARDDRMQFHSAKWIRSLLDLGLKPELQVIRDDIELEEHLNAEEVELIDFCRRAGFRLVNGTNGGDGLSGWKHTPERNRKISQRLSGWKHTDAMRARVVVARGGRPFCDQNGIVYQNQHECARLLGLNPSHICRNLKGKLNRVGEYRFAYV